MKEKIKIKEGYKIKEGSLKVEKGFIHYEVEQDNKDYHLKTRNIDGNLYIVYNVGKLIYEIGYISHLGGCYILNRCNYIENYETWREKGMLVDSTPVEWMGKEYFIDTKTSLRNLNGYYIYDFAECESCPFNKDENIIRFKHNNRPILF